MGVVDGVVDVVAGGSVGTAVAVIAVGVPMELELVVVVGGGRDAELREHEDSVPGAAGAGTAVDLAQVGGDEELGGGGARRRVVVVGAEGCRRGKGE